MYQRSKVLLKAFILLSCVLLTVSSFVFSETQQNQRQQNQNIQPTPLPEGVGPGDPALPIWMRPSSRMSAVTKGENTPRKVVSHVQNVTLPAVVTDHQGRRVTDLRTNNFTVYEKGAAQKIITCTREDVPVSIGILVDNSGSNAREATKSKYCCFKPDQGQQSGR